ncbi:GL23476 [Drosophila persimilis]|uniref:GL23476 n=1 Tax=Drosophila persimilis TaxID=7234 RepID=B4G3C2_DROPE|nr:GL23476 [Drosophila persimilis]
MFCRTVPVKSYGSWEAYDGARIRIKLSQKGLDLPEPTAPMIGSFPAADLNDRIFMIKGTKELDGQGPSYAEVAIKWKRLLK